MFLYKISLCFIAFPCYAATITHNLNVQIVQVFDDSGADGAPIAAPASAGSGSYLYNSEVNEIWEQAGIQVTFLPTVSWNNTEAQRLTNAERGEIYGETFSSTTGDPIPNIPTDALQIFFVWDHPGTGFDGTENSGWKNDTTFDDDCSDGCSASNAGNATLHIEGTFLGNGRSVMSNRGFAAESLSGTLAHEIGHTLGLRHVNDVNDGDAAGSTQDPNYGPVGNATYNMMWEAFTGPGYDSGLDNDADLTTLQENQRLNADQVAAAIFNGLALDPDGNGTGVLQAIDPIPEPSSLLLALFGFPILMRRRR